MALSFVGKNSFWLGATIALSTFVKSVGEISYEKFTSPATSLIYQGVEGVKTCLLSLNSEYLRTYQNSSLFEALAVTNPLIKLSFYSIIFALTFCAIIDVIIGLDKRKNPLTEEPLEAIEIKDKEQEEREKLLNDNSSDSERLDASTSKELISENIESATIVNKSLSLELETNQALVEAMKTINTTLQELVKLQKPSAKSETTLPALPTDFSGYDKKLANFDKQFKLIRESQINTFKAIRGLQELIIYLAPEDKQRQLNELQSKQQESRKL